MSTLLTGQLAKKLSRKALAEIRRNTKAFQKQQKDDQWFETFRLVFIACGDLGNPKAFLESYKQQLARREHTCRLITDHIESLRPEQAGYSVAMPLYAGK